MNDIYQQIRFGLAALGLGIFIQSTAPAAVLMLDFGSTTTSGAGLTSSPYHAASGLTDTTWNKVQPTSGLTGLLYANGTAATGIALDLGAVKDGTTIDLAVDPSGNSALGQSVSTGVYGSNHPGRDGIFHGSTDETTRLGLQVTGLAAGVYDIYISGRNTSFGGAAEYTFYAGAGSAGVNFDSATMTSKSVSFSSGSHHTSQWTDGGNYQVLTVTLSEGEALNIASSRRKYNDSLKTLVPERGFLNTVQIVAVPEPAALGILGMAGTLLLRRRRR